MVGLNKFIRNGCRTHQIKIATSIPDPLYQHGFYKNLMHNIDIYIDICYIYIKSKGIYQPENLMSNGSSRHDDAAQTK